MAPNTGSIADFHPADTNYNPAIRRHRGRPAAYRHSHLSAQLTPEAISTVETPVTDRSNRPRLTIQTSDLVTSPEPSCDEADTPHPSQDDGFSSTDEVLDSYFESQPPTTTDTSEPICPVSPTNDNDRSTGDRPLSPVSPIAGPSTVGPRVRTADEPHHRRPVTPLEQQRATLRTLLRDFDTQILEPGENEPHWMRFRGALQPAVQTLATDQIIHALKQHLPSVQETLSQNAQLRGALAETQSRQDANEVEMERLHEENRGLRGALDRLQVSGEEGERLRDLTLESEQMKIELEKAQKELQESFEEREIEEGNFMLEITSTEEALATLQRAHDAVLADRQLLRTQAQQMTQTVQRAQQEAREAGQEAAALRAQLQESRATATATTDRAAMLERQVMDSSSVVLDLREQIFNLESRQAKGKQRETSGDTETGGNMRTDMSHSPDPPEFYPAPPSPPSPPPTRPAPFPPTSAEDTTAPSPSLSPLRRARRNLLADQRNIASIIDPLEASAYSTWSVSKTAIHKTTDSGLAGTQIVKAIRDHLPDIRDRQRLKGAYRRLELRRAEDQKLIEQLRSAAANKQRAIDIWKGRVQVLEKKNREAEEAEEEETNPVAGTTPATASSRSSSSNNNEGESSRRAETADMDPYTMIRDDLRETRTQRDTVRRENALLLAADETKTAQLQSAQQDVARLTKEITTLRQALDAAAATTTTTNVQQTALVESLNSQLADQRRENNTLHARLTDARTAADTLRVQLADRDAQVDALQTQGADQGRMIDALRTEVAAHDAICVQHADESRKNEILIQDLRTRLADAERRLSEQAAGHEQDGGGRVISSTTNTNTAVAAERWRNGNWDAQGANGFDFFAFWTLMLLGLGFGWWVVGGEVSGFLVLVVCAICFFVGAVVVGVRRGEFGLVDA